MGQASNARTDRRVHSTLAVAVAATLSLAASSAAIAAEPMKSVDGLLQLPNVSVVNAPQAATAASPTRGGMRAYKDVGGELRGPTNDEMAAAAAAPAASKSATLRRSATSDASTGADYALPSGGVGVALDESSMQYSVVVRQEDGSLKEICVTGPDAADAVVKKEAAARSIANKESKNVR